MTDSPAASEEARADRALEAAVVAELEALGAEYELIPCDPDLADTAEFCAHYGYSLDISANTIVVGSRREPKVFAACLVLGSDRLDVNRTVRRLLGVRKVSFASPEDTRGATGMRLGGVTPFGLPEDLPLYVDAGVMMPDRVIVGGGSRALKVLVNPAVFAAMDQAEVVEGLALHPG